MKPADAAPVTTPAGVARVVIFADDGGRAARLHAHVMQFHGPESIVTVKRLAQAIDEAMPPDLVVLDVQTSGTDPLPGIKHIKQVAPDTRIIVIMRESHPDLAQRALRAGVSAYLTADEVDTLMPQALQRIISGERFVSEDVMQGILQRMVTTVHRGERVPIAQLSDREMAIFQMIGLGKSLRTIATELHVNIKTVASHCNNMRRKLHSRDNHELAILCQRWAAEQSSSHA